MSALIGVATHLVWDAFTDTDLLPASRLLQYASTVFGLAAVAWFLWKRRFKLRTTDTTARLGTTVRRVVIALLILAPLVGAAVLARDDYNDYSAVTATWTAVAEGVLTGAAKRAGAALAVAVLIYAAAWQLTRRVRVTVP